MNQKTDSNTRILAREVAQEMTVEEMQQVSGGACTTTTKRTFAADSVDADVTLTCTL